MLGRRGPAQAAFTNPELRELGELAEADVIVDPADVEIDAHSRLAIEVAGEATERKNVEILQDYAQRDPSGKPRRVVLRFLASPVAIHGTDRVESIEVVRNRLERDASGVLRARSTGEHETIHCGLVFRSIGYRGVALPGVPFDDFGGPHPQRGGTGPGSGDARPDPRPLRGRLDQARAVGRDRDQQARRAGDGRTAPRRLPRGAPARAGRGAGGARRARSPTRAGRRSTRPRRRRASPRAGRA